ncbi:hypothetical protein FB451DRAFT_1188721 [Mycena latifolia]|nr:hypothetical protein FB451DRAFT_1188721 [Mycena latifolia]
MASQIDENFTGLYTPAHLASFRKYATYVRAYEGDAPPIAPPRMYNIWVYQLREKYGNLRELPPFSNDYTGDIPGLSLDAARGASTTTAGADFAMRFAESQLAIANRASNAMMDQAERASVRSFRGRGRFRNWKPTNRSIDTYLGTAYAHTTRGHSPAESTAGRKHDRSPSFEDRAVRRRRERSYSRESTHHRSVSPAERGRHAARSPYRRPSSRSMDETARRSLERDFRVFQKARDDEIARKASIQKSRTAAPTTVTMSHDVVMTPVPEILNPDRDLIDLSEPANSGKGKQKDPAEGPGLPSTSKTSAQADDAFLKSLFALDDNGNIFPPLPESEDEDM